MAWTERYVRADAAGSGDGTTDTNSGANGAFTLAEAIADAATPHTGYRYNVKAGTYANTTTSRTFSGSGTTAAPIWWRGFKTTAGDLDSRPTSNRTVSTDIPHLTFTTGIASCTGDYNKFTNMSFLVTGASGAAAFRATGTTNGQIELHRCRFEHQSSSSANNRGLRMSITGCLASECYVKATTSAIGVYVDGTRSVVQGCYVLGGLVGIQCDLSANLVIGNIVSGSVDGITESASNQDLIVIGNTLYNLTGHGVIVASTYSAANRSMVVGNLFHTIVQSGKVAINYGGTAVANIYRWGNAYYNVTTPETGFGDTVDWDRVTETIDPMPNAGSGDFSLNQSALSFQSASPGLFEGLTMASYASVGAVDPRMYRKGGYMQVGVM